MADALVTAGLRPDLFVERTGVSIGRKVRIATLALLVVLGFGFRVAGLNSEGLSEDELNKLQAVADYREHGLTSANGEHPLLMKALQTGSMVLADAWNRSSSGLHNQITPETALRLPSAVFGAATSVLIYLLATELFGVEVGLISAALWAFDPNAIGFNRIAKEDTFLLFFFLFANVFWLRGQRVAESEPRRDPQKYYWATAAMFGAMLASKYLPQLLTISLGYYWLFQRIPETRWRLGKKRMLMILAIMTLTFVALNPTILLPATWKQMGLFAGQKLIGHDAYEFMGKLYSHRMTDWLNGIPWYFYHVFVAVKLPLLSLAGFLIGLPLIFRRKLGDGRYFILIWLFLWMMTFSFAGGKFTRYFTVALPAVLITSAIGMQFVGRAIAEKLSNLIRASWPKPYVHAAVGGLAIVGSIVAAAGAAPHFRLYTNALGGGTATQGYYFPHDEFYDGSMRDAIVRIATQAKPGAKVASESPTLASYYAQRANRPDLVCLLLSDVNTLNQLSEGDFVIDARGRHYFSNQVVISALEQSSAPAFIVSMGSTPSASVYSLDQHALEIVKGAARHVPPLAQTYRPRLTTSGKIN